MKKFALAAALLTTFSAQATFESLCDGITAGAINPPVLARDLTALYDHAHLSAAEIQTMLKTGELFTLPAGDGQYISARAQAQKFLNKISPLAVNPSVKAELVTTVQKQLGLLVETAKKKEEAQQVVQKTLVSDRAFAINSNNNNRPMTMLGRQDFLTFISRDTRQTELWRASEVIRKEGQPVHVFPSHDELIGEAFFRGPFLVVLWKDYSSHEKSKMELYEVSGSPENLTLLDTKALHRFEAYADQTRVYSTNDDGVLSLFDLSESYLTKNRSFGMDKVLKPEEWMSPRSQRPLLENRGGGVFVNAGLGKKSVYTFPTRSGQTEKYWGEFTATNHAVSPNGRYLALRSDGKRHIYDLEDSNKVIYEDDERDGSGVIDLYDDFFVTHDQHEVERLHWTEAVKKGVDSTRDVEVFHNDLVLSDTTEDLAFYRNGSFVTICDLRRLRSANYKWAPDDSGGLKLRMVDIKVVHGWLMIRPNNFSNWDFYNLSEMRERLNKPREEQENADYELSSVNMTEDERGFVSYENNISTWYRFGQDAQGKATLEKLFSTPNRARKTYLSADGRFAFGHDSDEAHVYDIEAMKLAE